MEENKNIQPLAAAEEPSFTSPYDGATEVSILQHAEKLKNQTTKEDGDTVQVYDVNGNPCKIEKSVLLEQTSKALPSVNDIKYLLALDASGNKLGLIPTEKLAEVLGKQLGINKTWLRFVGHVSGSAILDFNEAITEGYYHVAVVNGVVENTPEENLYGIMLVMATGNGYLTQEITTLFDPVRKIIRSRNEANRWYDWRKW